jgi:glycerol-3-phosphate dehydrogenase
MTTSTPGVLDVVVIGAGIVGAAIARDLAGTGLSVTLVEARNDVGDGTSKANTALLHTGYDATPGTLESRLVARGYDLLGDYAERTGIPIERTGALLVAWTDEEVDALPLLKDKAERNGYQECEIVDAQEVYRRVPELGAGALGGLTVPGEAIICTTSGKRRTAHVKRRRHADGCSTATHQPHRRRRAHRSRRWGFCSFLSPERRAGGP